MTMLLDTLEKYVSEEELVRIIADMIINGNSNEDLSRMGYSNDLIERAHMYAISLFY